VRCKRLHVVLDPQILPQERALPHHRRQAETGPRRERAGVDLVWTVAGTRSAPSWGRRLSIDAPGSCHTNGAIVATRAVPNTTPMQGGASCHRQHSCDSWRFNAAGRVLQGSSMHPRTVLMSATSEHLVVSLMWGPGLQAQLCSGAKSGRHATLTAVSCRLGQRSTSCVCQRTYSPASKRCLMPDHLTRLPSQ